jgi:hypothetical protein
MSSIIIIIDVIMTMAIAILHFEFGVEFFDSLAQRRRARNMGNKRLWLLGAFMHPRPPRWKDMATSCALVSSAGIHIFRSGKCARRLVVVYAVE